MLRMRSLAFALPLFAAACGGNVVVDSPGNGGAGGTSTQPTTVTTTTGTTTTGTTTTGTTSTISTSTTVTTTTVTTSTTSTSTTTTVSTTSWTGPCGGTVIGDPFCQQCVQNACCGELAECWPGSECSRLWTCFSSCKPHDTNCQSLCYEMYAGGLPALTALVSCSQDSCGSSECISDVCGVAQATGPYCGQCISNGCCAETEACFQDNWCLDCLSMPDNPSCDTNPVFHGIWSCINDWCGDFCF